MLLTDRRHRLLYVAIAGMEVGWIAPWAILFVDFWRQRLTPSLLTDIVPVETALDRVVALPPLLVYVLLLATMLLYMAAADLLNQRQIAFPWREAAIGVLVAGSSLLWVRLLIYVNVGLFSGEWLGNVFASVFNFTAGRRPEPVLLFINLFVWLRVAINTERDLTFFRVTFSFRLGLLIALVGNALLVGKDFQSDSAALIFFSLFLIAGLTAMAVARMDEKAYAVDSSRGALLPWARLGQIMAAALLVLGLGALIGLIYTPTNLRALLGWFAPLWRLLGALIGRLLFAIAWLLAPIMEWLINWLRRLMMRMTPPEGMAPLAASEMTNIVVTPTSITEFLNRWTYVRYGVVLLLLAAALGLVWFFFLRTTPRHREDESEEHAAEPITLGADLLGRGLKRLRRFADLVRRYGVGAQLLAAISIENIYANVGRNARERGYPRQPSQPPDAYLPSLYLAFPGCARELERITDAYMRVEYGDRTLDEIELAGLRQDYHRLQAAAPPDAAGTQG